MSIQEFVSAQILKGKSNGQIATVAAKKFPEAKRTDAQAVAWYRWNMKRKGVKKVPASSK